MIRSLHIENYALIEQLDINLKNGFSVITGETGAGKSILLGALGLLRGMRADSHAIKHGASRCVVEAVFDVSGYGLETLFEEADLDFDGSECIVRRELTAAGKSRAFVNDTPVTLTLLRQLGDRLIDIHSQHQNLLLGNEGFQTSVLDALAANQALLSEYATAYAAWRKACHDLAEAEEAATRSHDDEDYLRFQFNQLDEAQLQAGEQTELEAEAEMLEHAEDIRQDLYTAQQSIDADSEANTLQQLKSAVAALRSAASNFTPAAELAERAESCYIEMKDIAAEISSMVDDVECNPSRLEAVNDRLSLIYTLEQKHHVGSVEELIDIAGDLAARLSLIDNSDEHLEALRKVVEKTLAQATKLATKLTAARTKAAKTLEGDMEQSLRPLAMPNVRFHISVEPATDGALTATGADCVQFLFSANKNSDLQPVSQVASGGEIARVMLSLKSLIANAIHLPTIIFDEIDTGVSGSIAEKMARIMQTMGQGERQVISITHLPQIAALGTDHLRVFKTDTADATVSHIVRLSDEERVEEIAHMLSGEVLTQAAIDNAKNLLRQ